MATDHITTGELWHFYATGIYRGQHGWTGGALGRRLAGRGYEYDFHPQREWGGWLQALAALRAAGGRAGGVSTNCPGQILVEGSSATAGIIRDEPQHGDGGDAGHPRFRRSTRSLQDNAVIAGTPGSSPLIAGLHWDDELVKAGGEGFVIRTTSISGHPVTVIASSGEIGALYGAFHFLRLMQTARPIDRLNVTESPKVQLRLLNQWDNVAGTIERGYGGRSLYKWNELPDKLDPRYTDFARVNAAIGINGTVINNVNADVRMLNKEYLPKIAALAAVWRPYGLRLYLSIRFSSPVELDRLATADPLDPTVAAWWKTKADEIYGLIPDFGGFLVKANSEGQPGPKDYKRSHAEGANVIAGMRWRRTRAMSSGARLCMTRTWTPIAPSGRISSLRNWTGSSSRTRSSR